MDSAFFVADAFEKYAVFTGLFIFLSTTFKDSCLIFFETGAKVKVEGVDLFAGSRKVVVEPLVASTPSVFRILAVCSFWSVS